MDRVDEDAMHLMAGEVRERAHAPYSNFKVGAVIEMADGSCYAGCNVENVASPQSICAERNAITTAVAEGSTQLRRVYVLADPPASPCGGCRSVMAEFGTADTEVIIAGPNGPALRTTLGELLPHAFEMANRQESS